MKRHVTLLASGALLLATSLCPAAAQSEGTPGQPAKDRPLPAPDTSAMPVHAPAHARKTPARASDIIGTHIEDAAGHDIATIKDLVVCSSGQVVAVVEVEVDSRDDAMVGVPLGQLEARCEGDKREVKAMTTDQPAADGGATPDVEKFVLTGSRSLFDAAPLLVEEKLLDASWLKNCEDHYAADTTDTQESTGTDEKRIGVGSGADASAHAALASSLQPVCARKLIGENVNGSDGDSLGDVKDLAIDLRTGEAVYVIVSTGGVLGMGTSLHGIPYEHLTITEQDVVIPMTREGLSRLPELDLDHLPASTAMATVPERGHAASD